MLSYLAYFQELFGPFRLFDYLTFRGILAAATSLFLGFLIAPWILIKLRRFKLSQSIRDEDEVGNLAELHSHKENTPTMGGLIVFFALLVSSLLWAKPNIYVITALLVYVGLTLVGLIDDYLKISRKNSKGLASGYKLLSQALITIFVLSLLMFNQDTHELMRELWVPFIKQPLIQKMPYWFLFMFFFLILSGSSNAINLTDGIDGLAIGCCITVALVYSVMAYSTGHAIIADYLLIGFINGAGELAIICAAMVGASLAFLWYNAHPAEVFMGDTGSLSLGGLLGVIAFMVHQPITLILVGGIFVIEALSVIIQVASYKLRGKRVLKMAPIHHHFELMGWAESKVVVRFWILSLIFAIGGLITLKLR